MFDGSDSWSQVTKEFSYTQILAGLLGIDLTVEINEEPHPYRKKHLLRNLEEPGVQNTINMLHEKRDVLPEGCNLRDLLTSCRYQQAFRTLNRRYERDPQAVEKAIDLGFMGIATQPNAVNFRTFRERLKNDTAVIETAFAEGHKDAKDLAINPVCDKMFDRYKLELASREATPQNVDFGAVRVSAASQTL